eukprot:4228686-Amphidinium_carterae.1
MAEFQRIHPWMSYHKAFEKLQPITFFGAQTNCCAANLLNAATAVQRSKPKSPTNLLACCSSRKFSCVAICSAMQYTICYCMHLGLCCDFQGAHHVTWQREGSPASYR